MISGKGYVYHIKDEYFALADDSKLMQNKENGNYRPTYYCFKDEKTSLLWMIPMSSQAEKYESLYKAKCERYGKCDTIVISNYDGKKAAFLLQNMFPITEDYLDHIHTRNGNPVPVAVVVQKELETKAKRLLALAHRGKKLIFPDVIRLEKLMIEQQTHKIERDIEPRENMRIKERLAAAKVEADRLNSERSITRTIHDKDRGR